MFWLVEFSKSLLSFNSSKTSVPTIEVAASLAADIARFCEAGPYQKSQLTAIAQKSLSLANALEEKSRVVTGGTLQDRVEEIIRVLGTTRESARKWRNRSKIIQWMFQPDITGQMDRCTRELDDAIRSLQIGRTELIPSDDAAEADNDIQRNLRAPGGDEGNEDGGKSTWAAMTKNGGSTSSQIDALTRRGAVDGTDNRAMHRDEMVCVEQAKLREPSSPGTSSSATEKLGFAQEGREHIIGELPGLGEGSAQFFPCGHYKQDVKDKTKKDQIIITRYDFVRIETQGNGDFGKLKWVNDEGVLGYFDGFDPHQVIRDKTCFYVTFRRADSARRAQRIFSAQDKTLASLSVFLSVIPAPDWKDTHAAISRQPQALLDKSSDVAVTPPLLKQPLVVSQTPVLLSNPANPQDFALEYTSVPNLLPHSDARTTLDLIARSDARYHPTPTKCLSCSLSFPLVPSPLSDAACRSLLLHLMERNESIPRRLISRFTESDAQSTIDFLDEVLNNRKDLSTEASKRLLFFLETIAKLHQVFPARCELKNLQFDPMTPSYEGGFGYVCQGLCRGTTVCVKVVRLSLHSSDNLQIIKAQAKEFALWAHLSHPNIVPFYGIHRSAEYRICLISPWIQHGDLNRYLRTFPAAPRLPFLADVIHGLRYLHESNIIHADIKASNVLVSSTGQAMITDFGISRVAMTGVASTGFCNGTTRWTAPELVRNNDVRPSPESDVWSFACLCYEVLTGQLPFYQLKTDVQIVIALHKGGINPLKQTPKDTTTDQISNAGIQKFLETCWKYEPSERPSVEDIVRMFEDMHIRPSATNGDSDPRNMRPIKGTRGINYGRVFEILQHLQHETLLGKHEKQRQDAESQMLSREG